MLKVLSERSKGLSNKVCSILFCCQGSFAYLPNISRHYFHSSIGLHICLYITSLTKYHYLCQGFVANLLKSAFPHLSDNQIKITVTGLFNLNQDIPGFKVGFCLLCECQPTAWFLKTTSVNPIEFQDHLRDFLVQIREFTGEDDTDLYLEEREVGNN